MTIFFVLLAILLLGVLIVVHEFGHFITARALHIAVKEFSVGFGPKLKQWKSKKRETVYSLRGIRWAATARSMRTRPTSFQRMIRVASLPYAYGSG